MKRTFALIGGFIFLAGTASACPDYMLSGETYQATGEQLFQARRFAGKLGGDNDIALCPGVRPRTERGAGYFTTTPDFTIQLSEMDDYQLIISVVAQCDSSILIHTGESNWYFDDDDGGNLNSRLVLTQPTNGWMDVWLGSFDGAVCDAVMTFETFLK